MFWLTHCIGTDFLPSFLYVAFVDCGCPPGVPKHHVIQACACPADAAQPNPYPFCSTITANASPLTHNTVVIVWRFFYLLNLIGISLGFPYPELLQ